MTAVKILIADDDLHLRQGLTNLLAKAGYLCEGVSDGQQALDAVARFQPDLCIFDVMMPRLNGIELCSRLREQHHYQPVLLLTAYDEDIDRVEGFRRGADDYMTKPFRPAELQARVEALLRREQYLQARQASNVAPVAQPFPIGSLLADGQRMQLSYGDHHQPLSPRELKFLQLLRDSAGRVLSKDEILDHCWGRAYLPSSRVLDQFLAVLRKKIEKKLRAPRVVETVYGVGYRLKAEE
ncbi:response regulator transcription factor [Marinobacter zhejiangensis]|uniref:Two-component system, OmpR family, alkaline phosphatase synthesis response regulator PhoP n=1 Tax=Marinobacter zhejiangensis TaxID=488535 RepID=A0A1I4T434_9GAMM|nr:response regulator transcription factor [Marinobacter zhejiangensis]SFM71429.1 two-component system, OmpR family, alkaline phosphatase synthesis response regulator PhoP [Marinobacter zhejiangensis]